MPKYIAQLGPFGLLNIIILAFIIFFGLKNAYLLFIKRTQKNLSKLGRSINSMLFWGVIIIILSFLGTFLGSQAVFKVGMNQNSDSRVLFGGFYILFKLLTFSFTSFTIISIVWYIFTGQHRRLLERSMKEKYAER